MYALRGADRGPRPRSGRDCQHSVIASSGGGPDGGAGARAPSPSGRGDRGRPGPGRLSQIRITALPPRRGGRDDRADGASRWSPVRAWPRRSSPLGGTPVLPAGDRNATAGRAGRGRRAQLRRVWSSCPTTWNARGRRQLAPRLRRPGAGCGDPDGGPGPGPGREPCTSRAADFDSVVVMSSAAGHARHGAVTVAESPAMTMAGRCEAGRRARPGRRATSSRSATVPEVAGRVVERLLPRVASCSPWSPGPGAPPGLTDTCRHRSRRGGRRGGGRRPAALPTADGRVVHPLLARRLADRQPSAAQHPAGERGRGQDGQGVRGAKVSTVGDLLRHSRRYFSGTELSDLAAAGRRGGHGAGRGGGHQVLHTYDGWPRRRGWRPPSPTGAAP